MTAYLFDPAQKDSFRETLSPNTRDITPENAAAIIASIVDMDNHFFGLVEYANSDTLEDERSDDKIIAYYTLQGEFKYDRIGRYDNVSAEARQGRGGIYWSSRLDRLRRGVASVSDVSSYPEALLAYAEQHHPTGERVKWSVKAYGDALKLVLEPAWPGGNAPAWGRDLSWTIAYLVPNSSSEVSLSVVEFENGVGTVVDGADHGPQGEMDAPATVFGTSWVVTLAERVINNFDEKLAEARTTYIENWRATRRSAMQAEPVVPQKTREQKRAGLDAFRRKRKASMEASLKGEVIPTLPMLDHGYASSRTWGIEVESGGARGVQAPKGWSRKRDGSLRSAWEGYVEEGEDREVTRTEIRNPVYCTTGDHNPYTEMYDENLDIYINVPNENYEPYEDCPDCGRVSITEMVTGGTRHHAQSDDCAEFVSPILRSVHSQGLEKLLTEIASQPQNDSAGVHVHVGANDLTPKQLGSLIYGYDMIEGLIESSYRRNEREYCRLRRTDEILDIFSAAKRGENVPHGDRYVTVNLQALNAHGTVEFRAMGPVYDYEHLIRWAMFCREMVNLAAAGVTKKEWNAVRTWTDVTALFAKYGKEYIRASMFQQGLSVPSAPRLERDPSVSMPNRTETNSQSPVDTGTVSLADWEQELLDLFEERESQLVPALADHEEEI